MNETDRLRTAGNADSSGVPGKGWSSLRATFEAFRKRKFAVLACFLVLTLVFCGLHVAAGRRTAGTILSLDYEEASRGLTPNGTRFNIFEIRGGEMMERLIGRAGLEGQTTPEQLSECVSVEPTHDKSVAGGVNYISTSYVVRFTDKGGTGGKTAEEMLSLLCETYREYFVERYGFNHAILSFDVNDLKYSDEYLTTVDLLELKYSQLENYARLRSRESKNYRDPDTGITFSALEQRAKNLYTYDLAKLRSFIIENGIANDRSALSGMLNYRIRMDRLMYSKLMAAYDEDNKGIQMYDAAMSAAVMIPTMDQSREYYMSRTKTGMDNMALHADEQLTGATERMERIAYNTYLAEKLRSNRADAAKKAKADLMIREMEAALEKLASDIRSADSTYTSAKARDYLDFSEDVSGFAERTGLVTSLGCSAAVLLAVFALAWLRALRSDKERRV